MPNRPVPNRQPTGRRVPRPAAARTLVLVAGFVGVAGVAGACSSSGSSARTENTTATSTTTSTTATIGATGSSGAFGSVTSSSAPAAGANGVNIANYAFNPKSLTVKVGATVSWKNLDQFPHEVTSAAGDPGTPFDLGPQASGATVTHTFTAAGTYHYYCNIHNYMTGTIVVTP